jgi:hypothetical protein
MRQYPNIDYTFRPCAYWDVRSPLDAIFRNVSGTNRRAMIREYWLEGRLEQLDPVLLKDQLEGGERNSLTRIHPSFFGGKYMPPYLHANRIHALPAQTPILGLVPCQGIKHVTGMTRPVPLPVR